MSRLTRGSSGTHRGCPRDRRSRGSRTSPPSSRVRGTRAPVPRCRLRRDPRGGSRNACPSADATITPARPSLRRSSMWCSISESTSLSSSILGLANTAKPTLRSASTQGRTTSALPGRDIREHRRFGFEVRRGGTAQLGGAAEQPTAEASNRGRYAAVGRPPRIAPSPMSRFGASHTSSTRRCRLPPSTAVESDAADVASSRAHAQIF